MGRRRRAGQANAEGADGISTTLDVQSIERR
jgi:hypothetical protein